MGLLKIIELVVENEEVVGFGGQMKEVSGYGEAVEVRSDTDTLATFPDLIDFSGQIKRGSNNGEAAEIPLTTDN